MRSSRSVALVAILAVLGLSGPSTAVGQEENDRSGFWLSGGLGRGVNEDMEVGGSAYIRMGGTLGERLVLGGEVLTLGHDDGDATVTRGNVTASALFYPSVSGGFFLKGGLGVARIERKRSGLTSRGQPVTVTLVEEESPGTTLGLGYDIHLGDGNLYLTPNFDALLRFPDMEVSDTDAAFLVTVGIGFR